MAKFYGSIVKTGKVGGSVFSVRAGQTIERQYQPLVYNPSTTKQIEARAKMKTISQMSALFAPAIGFRKEGMVSPRNKFTSVNYQYVTYGDGEATMQMSRVKLTNGVLSLPNLTLNYASTGLTVRPTTTISGLSKVLYFVYTKEGNAYRYYGAAVGDEDNNYEVTISGSDREYLVYAYGLRVNDSQVLAKYANILASSAEAIVTLLATTAVTSESITLTETKYGRHTPEV